MRKTAKTFRPTAFSFPYLAITLAFVIVPLVLILFYAFRGEDGSFTFSNFAEVFKNEETLNNLWGTVKIAFISTAICLLIAYPVAYILASSPFNKIAVFSLIFIIPMWINFLLRMFALKSVLSIIGIERGYTAAVIGMVYDFFPYMLLPIYTVLVNMDKSYLEASNDLGANNFRTFFKITLPLSLSGIISGISMMFMPIFSSYAITEMMGDMGTSVIGAKIASLFESHDYGYGSALSFVLLIIVLLVVFITTSMTGRASKTAKVGKAQ